MYFYNASEELFSWTPVPLYLLLFTFYFLISLVLSTFNIFCRYYCLLVNFISIVYFYNASKIHCVFLQRFRGTYL
jgi:hypothetical protein